VKFAQEVIDFVRRFVVMRKLQRRSFHREPSKKWGHWTSSVGKWCFVVGTFYAPSLLSGCQVPSAENQTKLNENWEIILTIPYENLSPYSAMNMHKRPLNPEQAQKQFQSIGGLVSFLGVELRGHCIAAEAAPYFTIYTSFGFPSTVEGIRTASQRIYSASTCPKSTAPEKRVNLPIIVFGQNRLSDKNYVDIYSWGRESLATKDEFIEFRGKSAARSIPVNDNTCTIAKWAGSRQGQPVTVYAAITTFPDPLLMDQDPNLDAYIACGVAAYLMASGIGPSKIERVLQDALKDDSNLLQETNLFDRAAVAIGTIRSGNGDR
jgi:hypothetical protein